MVQRKSKKTEIIQGEVEEEREAPAERQLARVINPMLTKEQIRIISGVTPEYAVQKRIGKGGKTFKYVKHGYVTDQLNSAFGYDWDLLLDPIETGSTYSIKTEDIRNDKGDTVGQNRYVAVSGRLIVRI